MRAVQNKEPSSNIRRQDGMDRVIEKSPWQQHKTKTIWAGALVLAVVLFWFFKPDA